MNARRPNEVGDRTENDIQILGYWPHEQRRARVRNPCIFNPCIARLDELPPGISPTAYSVRAVDPSAPRGCRARIRNKGDVSGD